MKHIILGAGQVSNAIKANILGTDITVYDKGQWESLDETGSRNDILHVCIPYDDSFCATIITAIRVFLPEIIIIHSTVKPGTCASFGHKGMLYSPVNGRHDDNFSNNIKIYPKMFAGNKDAYERVKDSFGFFCKYTGENTSELEFAKISCTNYMYWNLMYQHEIYNECSKRGYDFDLVYTKWNEIYNQGINRLHPEWVRPLYQYQDGLPGGHCLRPNLGLDDNNISKVLKSYEEREYAI